MSRFIHILLFIDAYVVFLCLFYLCISIFFNGKYFFAWYDCFVGYYYDRHKKIIYIFPLPMFGIKIGRRKRNDNK